MDTNTVLEVIENELECIKRADKCDRHCEDCPLVMEAENIIECYEWVIKELEKKKQLQLVDRLTQNALINWHREKWYKEKYGLGEH